ncbi:hypothetical protein CCACVL1_11542 [Corchorus capsularis]|uniref:Uncharacterized protein n=1 Tax=Corchorus capsularis TaxID=210143 RepID=A0A1R3IKQ9_COCAP|nr:hypothetical protein CCACVL1_11542 [Corchorus capsularis]
MAASFLFSATSSAAGEMLDQSNNQFQRVSTT